MSITGLHIPFGHGPMAAVPVNERNVMSYYPYVNGGPAEAGHLTIKGWNLAVYVNSRYPALAESTTNPRASFLFEVAGVGMVGGAVRGDALVVLDAEESEYERSLPPELLAAFLAADTEG